MSSILFFFQGARRRVILSERAERARAKDLLFSHVFAERRSFAPGGKQVLRACGAQDDNAHSLGRMEYKMGRREV